MSFDWFWNLPQTLHTSWTGIVVALVGLFVILILFVAWTRAVRQKHQAQRESQEALQREAETFRKRLAEQGADFEATLQKDRAEIEERAARNIEQSGRMAEERIAAATAELQARLDEQKQASDLELERVRLALELEKEQAQQQAELERSQLAMEHTEEMNTLRRHAEEQLQSVRDEAARQLQLTTAQANQSIEEARSRFAASLAEQSHKHAEELAALRLSLAADAESKAQAHACELEALRGEHASAMEEQSRRHAAELQSLRETSAAALEEKSREHAREIESLQASHAAAMEERARQHAEEIRGLRSTIDTSVDEQSRKQAEEIERIHAGHAARLAQLIQQHGDEVLRLQAAIEHATARANEFSDKRAAVEAELHDLRAGQAERLSRIKRVWDEPPLSEPPRFLPPSERKTRFLSVANLKGGVGKTTIAGNAGVSLACRGHRVLLVDLDFQGSLTQVAVDRTTLSTMVKRFETARALFERPLNEMGDWLEKIIHPVECMPAGGPGKCDIIGAWNDLADVELREEARWILQPERDARYRIREIFHRPEITDNYDYVIFDCPPRLTTAAVNALAASDGVIIPIMLDWQSAAPILYMLRRLRDLKPVLTGGRVIGMVANQVRFLNNRPVQQMQSIFEMVCKRLDAEHLTAEDAFRVMVKADQGIGADVNAGRIAAARPLLRPLFDELTDSIERVTRHESLALV